MAYPRFSFKKKPSEINYNNAHCCIYSSIKSCDSSNRYLHNMPFFAFPQVTNESLHSHYSLTMPPNFHHQNR